MAKYESWLIGELVIEERITSFIQRSDELTEKLLWMLGQDVRDDAKTNAPKDTTALSESISVTTHKRSDYSSRTSIAAKLRETARMAPKSIPPKNAVDIHAPVHYATFQEVGWTDRGGRYHPGRPYLIPALMNLSKHLNMRFNTAVNEYLPGLSVRKEIIQP